MFVPEYTITQKTLRNIGLIEYSKAVVDSITLLPNNLKMLQKDAKIRSFLANLRLEGFNHSHDTIKRFVDNLATSTNQELVSMELGFRHIQDLAQITEINEDTLIHLNTLLTRSTRGTPGSLRQKKMLNAPNPSEILAELTEFFDWFSSLEGQETHPIINAAIVKAKLETLAPFENQNTLTSNLFTHLVLKSRGYSLQDIVCLESGYINTRSTLEQIKQPLSSYSPDFTQWIEYFTDLFATEATNTKEKYLIMAKESKLAKASGKNKLTPRQQKVLEYLQDYGVLFNRDFHRIFPDKSEDSVLRDLKTLISQGIIKKTGSTKSSRYELS